MKQFRLQDFKYEIVCDGPLQDAEVSFESGAQALCVSITAGKDRPRFVRLKWDFPTEEDLYVLGDAWERSYGELSFRKLSAGPRPMPWYFAATNEDETWCFGVRTQPNSFVCFTYDETGITALIDCRNGGAGVRLDGRKVSLCTFVYQHDMMPPFPSLKAFCRRLCEKPLLPKEKIYGGNNWYYAYGESSYEQIVSDAKLQQKLSEGIENRPFMVVDDGWQSGRCQGPYEPNDRFRDMKALAEEMKALSVRPGIWVRLLKDVSPEITDDMRILRDGKRIYLDPTHPAVQAYITEEIHKIRSWGYELLKHDFTTVDLFGLYGKDLTYLITPEADWHFKDDTRTNAQIVLDLYRLILKASGDMLLIGCNTVSHLCAGLVHMNRTGDDTSGKSWERTRKMGVNTLAFRLAQDGAFYMADADCVGILDDNIPWEKNRQWLDVLSKSDTALFSSCAELSGEQAADMRKAYLEIQKSHRIRPLDIYDNLTPGQWEIDGEKTVYNW